MIPHDPGTWMNRGPWRQRGYSRVRTHPFQESVPGIWRTTFGPAEGGGSIRECTGFTCEHCYEHQSWDSRRPSARRPSGIPLRTYPLRLARRPRGRLPLCRTKKVLADQLNPVNRSGQHCPCLFIKGALMTIAIQTAQNGGAASDTAVAQISDTDGAGLSRTSPVAGYLVTLTIETWTVFVQSLVGMTRDLFDGFAAEVRKVIGLTVDDAHQAGLCLGDPTAYV